MESKTVNNLKVAEVELRYRTKVNPKDRAQVKSSQDAYEIFMESWNNNTIEYFEEFKVLLLNRNNKVLGITTLTKGSSVGTIVDIKLLLQYALKTNASSIIVAHNHPSGNIEPSDADKKITYRIKHACNLMEISLLDHLIILTITKYFSFSDEGLI
ncbi:MAG: DNA repair protein [Asgard group archaeon]|nr:DNA repair protein [Asgard group archaeon]